MQAWPQLFTTDSLSRHSHETEMRKYQACALPSMQQSCKNMPDYKTAEEIRTETPEDENLSILADLVICSWPSTKPLVQKELQPFRDDTAIIHVTAMKGS